MPEDWGDTPVNTAEDWGDEAVAPSSTLAHTLTHPGEAIKGYAAGQLDRLKASVDWRTGNIQDFGALTTAPFKIGAAAALSIPVGLVDWLADGMTTTHKAWSQGLSPGEEIGFAGQNLMMAFGLGENVILPHSAHMELAAKEFHETVTKPIVQRLAEVTANKPTEITVPLDPKNIAPEAKPETITTVTPETAQANLEQLVNEVKEARDLGVVGGPREPVPGDTPFQAAQRAMAANRKDDKVTMTPAGEAISEFEKRFNYKMERIERPEDFKQIWKEAAAENDFFPDARTTGKINPAHKEMLAEAAGVDPTTVKDSFIRDNFDRPKQIEMAAANLDKLTADFKEASLKYEADQSPTNKAAMLKAAVLKSWALEQTTGYDAEWGHSGHTLLKVMKPSREQAGIGGELTEGLTMPKPVKDLTDAIGKFKENATNKVKATGKDKDAPLGLDKLIQAAADLVDEAGKPVEKGKKPTIPSTPELNELVKTAKAVVNLMDIERPKLPGVATVRPLRALLAEKSPQGQSALAKFNKLVTEAEKNASGQILYKNKMPSNALEGPLADLVQRAENVTNYFGGAGVEKAVEDLMNRKGWTDEDLLNISRAVNRTDIKGAARLMASMRDHNVNMLYWLWTQGLISGPFTHAKYALANASFALTERGVTTPMAAMIGKLRGRADADRVLGGESMAGIWGLIRGIPDAFRVVKETPWGQRAQLDTEKILLDRLSSTGEEIPKDLLRTSQPFGRSPIENQILARTLGAPGYVAGDIHTVFKEIGNAAGKNAEAYRAARLEGKKISDPDFWDRLEWHKANLSTEALMKIRDDAYRGTFMRQLPEALEALQGKVKQGRFLKWIFPFLHIPLNLMATTLEHTPLAVLDPRVRADLMGKNGGRAQDMATARMVTGALIMTYFVNEAMQGRATGSYPKSPEERAEWAMNHKIPNAQQIGDSWWSFDKFGPIGSLASIGADIGHIISSSDKEDPENWTKMTWLTAQAAMDAASDFPGFLTLQSAIRAKENPNEGPRFMASQASSLLPFSSLLSQTASATDPYMREARTFVDGLLYRLPGGRETVAPKLDPLYGTPVENPGFRSVIRNVPVEQDPIKAELTRLHYFPTAPKNEIGGAKLTPEQYAKYQATAGPLVKQALTDLILNPGWVDYNKEPEVQLELVKSAISEARAQARGVIQADSMTNDGTSNLVNTAKQRRIQQIKSSQ